MIRSHYQGITEYEILWHDWNWVRDTIARIHDDQNERDRMDKRWSLLSGMACVAAVNGEEGHSLWKGLYDSTFTSEEKQAEADRAEAEAEKMLIQQRAERAKMLGNGGIIRI